MRLNLEVKTAQLHRKINCIKCGFDIGMISSDSHAFQQRSRTSSDALINRWESHVHRTRLRRQMEIKTNSRGYSFLHLRPRRSHYSPSLARQSFRTGQIWIYLRIIVRHYIHRGKRHLAYTENVSSITYSIETSSFFYRFVRSLSMKHCWWASRSHEPSVTFATMIKFIMCH